MAQTLYILNPLTLKRVHPITKYQSFIWKPAYQETGSFEIVCDVSYFDFFQNDFILEYPRDRNHFGIIQFVNKLREKDVSKLIIKGKMVSDVLSWRVAIDQYEATNKSSTYILEDLINYNFISPANEKRKMDNLIISSKDSTSLLDYTCEKGANVLEELLKICKTTGEGLRVSDKLNGKLNVEIYSGVDRTYSQSANKRIILEQSKGTLKDIDFSIDTENYVNYGYIIGDNDSATGKPVETTYFEDVEQTGWGRREEYFSLTYISKTIQTEDQTVEIETPYYINMLKNECKSQMENLKVQKLLNCEMNLNSRFKYREDFNLGDIITVRDEETGYSTDVRLINVIESIGSDGEDISVILGDKSPLTFDKIKLIKERGLK